MFAEENIVKTFVKFKNLYTSYVTYLQFMASKISAFHSLYFNLLPSFFITTNWGSFSDHRLIRELRLKLCDMN